MNKISLLVAAVVALGMAGCGKKETVTINADGNKVTSATDAQDGKSTTTVEGPGGKVTSTGDNKNGTVTIESDKGKSSFSSGVKVSEAELGMPMYPGARSVNGTKVDVAESTSYTVTFETDDGVAKVIAFYKPKLAGAKTMQLSGGENESSMLMKEEGKNVYHIQASKSGGKVSVTLMHAIKK